jgi:hypothetical protein
MKIIFAAILLSGLVISVSGQRNQPAKLQLIPVRGTSKIKLVYKTRSEVLDLDGALGGSNGSLAGNPPHQFQVLFTAEKDGFLYLVAKVCSASPISAKSAPCGGDHPCAILWIKADAELKQKESQSEIYQSCSYNFYDSKLKLAKDGMVIDYGAREKKELSYDNALPEKGLVIKSLEPAK